MNERYLCLCSPCSKLWGNNHRGWSLVYRVTADSLQLFVMFLKKWWSVFCTGHLSCLTGHKLIYLGKVDCGVLDLNAVPNRIFKKVLLARKNCKKRMEWTFRSVFRSTVIKLERRLFNSWLRFWPKFLPKCIRTKYQKSFDWKMPTWFKSEKIVGS